jgi:DNA-binding LacI/PurR family transcriptional regulator
VPESGFFTPPLTTVRQEFGEVGRAALRLLVDQLTSGERSTDSVLVEPVLVPRQTVGAFHSGRPQATERETGHG